MSIDAGQLVSVTPGVIDALGSGLDFVAVMVSNNARAAARVATPYASATAVATYFGSGSTEATLAAQYFLGFQNSNIKPAKLYVWGYASAARPAYLRGATPPGGGTLANIQTIVGTIGITADGSVKAPAAVNLSGAGSLSAAGVLICSALTLPAGTVTWDPLTLAFVISSTVSITFCTGTVNATLGLASTSTGAAISPAVAMDTPAASMDALAAAQGDWVTFFTTWDPDAGSGFAVKTAFATWVNGKGTRYVYSAWDTDPNAKVSGSTNTFAAGLIASGSNGTAAIYAPTLQASIAAALAGGIASVDFAETNGRTTMAYRAFDGLTPDVTDSTISQILDVNGYNFYGSYATANDKFNLMQPGSMSGEFLWIDTYINQVWLVNQFQLAALTFLTAMKSLPYNQAGYDLLATALRSPINAGVNFGAIRAGVTLTGGQIAELQAAAGTDISGTLFTQGWFLQILDPGGQVRQARGSPVISFWYCDGGSIQKLQIASIAII